MSRPVLRHRVLPAALTHYTVRVQNWEFEMYVNNRSNSYVRNSILYLQPTLTAGVIGAANVMGNNYDYSLWVRMCVATAGGGGVGRRARARVRRVCIRDPRFTVCRARIRPACAPVTPSTAASALRAPVGTF